MPLLAAWTSRWSWRNDQVTAQRLHSFALAEHNTFLELTQAAELTTDPQRAAAYLQHAVDEARHARAFSARSRALGSTAGPPRADSEGLFARMGEADFLAFVARGEARAVEQFTAYEAWFADRDPRLAGLFGGLLEDERRHAAYSAGLMTELSVQPRPVLATLGEAWSLWMRLGRSTSRGLFALGLLLMAPALLLLGLYIRVVRPAPAGV